MASRRIIVAIDGPAGAGKSTIARRVAAKIGAIYVDTGAMYRAIALWALRSGVATSDMHSIEELAKNAEISFSDAGTRIYLNGEEVTEAIRQPAVSQAASEVAAIPGVRRALVAIQRDMSEHDSLVMEGRDIGSVVFPDAQIKVFLDAQPLERARRRAEELSAKGHSVALDELERAIRERDERDRLRDTSPLIQAPDAAFLDSTGRTLEQVEEAILQLIRNKTTNGKDEHK
jgi:cytidylate kinase